MKRLSVLIPIILCSALQVIFYCNASEDTNDQPSLFFDFKELDTEDSDTENIKDKSEKPKATPEKALSEDEQTTMVNQLESLTNELRSFTNKAATIPDIDNRIRNWISNNDLKTGTINNWNDLYSKIEVLQTMLHKLHTHDRTGTGYRYLKYLAANPELYNKLITLKEKFTSINATLHVDTNFGLVKLTPESKDALKQITGTIVQAIADDNLIVSIADLLKKFDPEAAKIVAEEKKLATRALLQKGRGEIKTLESIGSEPGSSFGLLGGGSLDLFGLGNSPYSFSSFGTETPKQTPTTTSGGTPSSSSKGGGSATNKFSDNSAKSKDKDKSDEQKKKEERARTQEAAKTANTYKSDEISEKPTQRSREKGVKSPSDDSPDGLIKQIDEALHEARNLTFSSENIPAPMQVLSPLVTLDNFAKDKPISYEVIAIAIPKFFTSLIKINDLVKKLSEKVSKRNNLKRNAQQKLKSEWNFRNKDEETQQSAGFTQWLERITDIFKQINANPTLISTEQKEAYFWNREPDNTVKPVADTTPSAIPGDSTMKELFDKNLSIIEEKINDASAAHKEIYDEVKTQITQDSIRRWLEYREILVDGKPSEAVTLLLKDPTNPYILALQQARELTSLELIKNMRFASLYNVALALQQTKTIIEAFISGKPINKATLPNF